MVEAFADGLQLGVTHLHLCTLLVSALDQRRWRFLLLGIRERPRRF